MTTSFSETTGATVIWSILEGANGGSIDSQYGGYQAPVNHTPATETFHIVAINSQNPAQYAKVPINVTSSNAKTASTIVVSSSATQVPIGANLTIYATVQASGGTPTGSVIFYDSGKTLGTGIVNNAGVAAYGTASLALGFHSITATYSGDNNYSASTTLSAVTIAIIAIDPQLSVSPTSGSPGVTSFVKTDTGFTPYKLITHTATFPDNSVSVLQTSADGNGFNSYRRTYTMLGTYSQTDTDVTTGQTTTPVSWTVSPVVTNDFSLQMSPSTQAVNQGSSVTYTVITTTASGSSQSIALSASNLPTGVTASFNPGTVTSGSQSILTLSATSSAGTGTYSLTLVGTGSSATHTTPFSATVAQVTTSGAQLTSSPLNFNFNPQTINTASAPFVFSLVNSGGTALTISSLTVSPQFFPSFLNGLGLPITLQPNGGYANMQVVFIPTATSQQTGTIKLFNSTNASPLTLNVSGMGVAAPVTTGNIQINTTFNGSPWNGDVVYALTGPMSYNGGTAPNTYYNLAPGSYTVAYTQAGPGGATFTGITPSATQTLTVGSTITYTLNFTGSNTFAIGDPQPITTVMGTGQSASIQLPQLCLETGAAQTIQFAMQGLPLGASVIWSANPLSLTGCGQTETATITTSNTTPPGVYNIQITGKNQSGSTSTTSAWLSVNVPPASPDALVSVASNGTQGNGDSGGYVVTGPYKSYDPLSVSADGHIIAFSSSATNLVSQNVSGLLVRDTTAGTTILGSAAADGTPASGAFPSLSADGKVLVFESSSSNLPNPATYGYTQGIYVRDLSAGTITRIDLASDGTPGNGNSSYSSISADGRFVAFQSTASNLLLAASSGGIFVYDRKTGSMKLASISSDESVQAYGELPRISASGRYVLFASSNPNLVTNDTNGRTDAFVHDFVTGETTRVNVASNGTQDSCGVVTTVVSPLAISADGRYAAFYSCGDLVQGYADPRGGSGDVYVHDMVTGQTSPLGIDQIGDLLNTVTVGGFSADGRFIAVNGSIIDQTTGKMTRVDVLSDGSGSPAVTNTVYYGGDTTTAFLSSDGSHAVFASNASNLVSNDNNGHFDVFEGVNSFLASPRLASILLSANQAPGGTSVTGTLTLNAPAPIGGAAVSVWTDNSSISVPAIVTIPEGASSAPFTIPTSLVSSETVMTIIASYNGGSGVALLTLEPAAELSVSPTAWDYGYQGVGATSAVESFALTNSGTAALTINSAQLTSGQVFNISTNTCGSSIAAGGSCSVSVTFNPSASGAASDAVQISYGSPATIQSINLTGNGAVPLAGLSPTPLSFGSQTMPGSTTAIATLSNSGNASLTGISASISGTNAGDYAISNDGCSGVILPANSNCLVTIAFTPKAKGSRQATLSMADSASGSPQTISLAGTGVQSTPTLLWNPSTSSLTYGTPLGSGVLDATANQNGSNLAGTFAYTATLNSGTPQVVTQATVLGTGTYTLTATFTPTDGINYTTVTATTTLAINKASSTTALVSSVNPSAAGQSVNFTATVTGQYGGTATGSVTFSNGSTSLGSTNLSSGSAVLATSVLPLGTDSVTAVYNGDTNFTGSTSNSVSQVVVVPNPTPVITGISPAFTNAGGAAFTLTVTGLGFTSGSTVYWGTSALTTTYGSATQLTAQVPATDIATAGTTAAITVQTPSPGGGTSNSFQFEVNSASGSTTGPTFTSTTATVTASSPASYPVTLPSIVESASVTCLNLPTGAACSYSATTNTLTITTSSTTPKGTYQITVVFTETVSGAASGYILLPILLLPLVYLRRKLAVRGIWITAYLGLVLLASAAYTTACGGGGSTQTTTPPPQTHQVVSSGSVSITIQ